MKKIFTLVAAVMAAFATNVQAQETLAFKIDPYPWNYSVALASNVEITYNSQWGEYGIIGASNAINPADYKGYRIEYTPFASTATTDGYVQTSIGDTNAATQYDDFPTDGNVLEKDFNEGIKSSATLTKFNIQGKASGAKILIKKVTLIKNDNTEEPVTFAGGGWGHSLGPVTTPIITYTGQYGGVEIVTTNGNSCTYSHETQKDSIYNYTIELNEPLKTSIMVEYDGAAGGFAWNNYEAGISTINFTVNDSTAAEIKTDDAGNITSSTPKDIAKIYLKANDADNNNYPFTANIKSVTRVRLDATGINDITAKDVIYDANAPLYNLAGQKVGKDYKGVVIQNGKKRIQ